MENRKPLLGTIVGADAHIGPYIKLSPIGEVVEKYTKTIPGIDSYAIMPNHVHMILRLSAKHPAQGPMWSSAPTDTPVEKMIRSWKILIAKELGTSIWQRSYYDHVIRNEQAYVECTKYIQENPVNWCVDRYYPGY